MRNFMVCANSSVSDLEVEMSDDDLIRRGDAKDAFCKTSTVEILKHATQTDLVRYAVAVQNSIDNVPPAVKIPSDNSAEKKEDEGGWQGRMAKEYRFVKDKYDKLHAMLNKYEAGTLDFTPNCSLELLKRQQRAMGEYLNVLEIRAEIEGITFVK